MPSFGRLTLVVWVLGVSALGFTQILQSESFDFGFVLGDIEGQNGWIVAPGGNLPFTLPGMVEVSSDLPRSGTRCVEIVVGTLLSGESLFAYRPLAAPVVFGSQGVVLSEVWVRFGTAAGGRRGVYTYDSTGTQITGLTVDSSNGLVYPDWILGPSLNPPLAPDTWHRFTLAHDLLNGRAQGYVNGVQVSSQAGAFVAENFSDINLYADGSGPDSAFFDDVRVERVPLGTIRGRVLPGDYLASTAGLPVQIRLITPGSGAVAQTINTTLNAEGEYSAIAFIRGTYSVQVKPWHWTSKTMAPTIISDLGLYFLQTSHANGDVDASDEVDAADIDRAIQDFGSTGQLITDVDGSEEVDAADIDIVIANFGAVGD